MVPVLLNSMVPVLLNGASTSTNKIIIIIWSVSVLGNSKNPNFI